MEIVNALEIRKVLQQEGAIFQGTSDTEILLHLISRIQSSDLAHCVQKSVSKLVGAFSFVILSKNELIALRDPLGFRPLSLGKMKNQSGEESWMVASETCAFDLIGAEFVCEILPGEMVKIDSSGLKSFSLTSHQQKTEPNESSHSRESAHVFLSMFIFPGLILWCLENQSTAVDASLGFSWQKSVQLMKIG